MRIENRKRIIVIFTGLVFAMLLTGADGGGACSGEIQGDPPSQEIQELLDILRTADHAACKRDGEGWPLGECPPGCVPAPSPAGPYDAVNECRITDQQLGGPSVCIQSSDADRDCGQSETCWLHEESERVWLVGGEVCYPRPEGWSGSCWDFSDYWQMPDCGDEESEADEEGDE